MSDKEIKIVALREARELVTLMIIKFQPDTEFACERVLHNIEKEIIEAAKIFEKYLKGGEENERKTTI